MIVRTLITDVLSEIGVLAASETPEAGDAQLALRYFQRQIDAWQADRLTLSTQLRTPFTLPPGTGTITIGPVGAQLIMVRPVWIDAVNYVIPGSSPEVEVPVAILDTDTFAAISIKGLLSTLPTSCTYQTDIDTVLGRLTFWPVTSGVKVYLYTPQAVTVPATLDTVLLTPAGYEEAFHYQLALRLCRPFGVAMTQELVDLATKALATAKRPNVAPGLLGIDAALVPMGGGGYNVFSDNSSGR